MKNTTTLSIFISLLSALLILSGCGSGGGFFKGKTDTIPTYNFRSGTQGVAIKYVDGMPPKLMYVGSEFATGIEIENKGAYDITSNADISLSVPDDTAFSFTEGTTQSFTLRGKSLYLKEGESNLLNFPMKALCFPGYTGKKSSVVTNYTRKLKAKACYYYETTANQDLCIDTLKFTRQKGSKGVCTMQDVSLSGGQGGPVGVTRISPTVIPKSKTTTVQLGIEIRKLQGLDHSIFHPANGCNLDYQNKVTLQVTMGGKPLTCTPSEIQLKEKSAVSTLCKIDVSSDLGAYKSPVLVNMKYYVQQILIKDFTVQPPPGGVDCTAIKTAQ